MGTVKGYVDRVVIVAQGQVVATHTRCLQHDTMVLDPLHYLATLSRKPGRWTTHRCTGTGSFLPASRYSVPNCKHCMAAWPVTGGSCGSCNSWVSTPWLEFAGPLKPAGLIVSPALKP